VSHERDLVAYVTGELAADQAAALERRERDDPAFAAEVAALRRVVARLTDVEAEGWAPASPPPLAVDPSAREPAAPRGRLAALGARLLVGTPGRPVVLRPGLAAGLAAVLLLVGAGAGAVLRGGGDDGAGRPPAVAAPPARTVVALHTVGEGAPGAGAEAAMATGRMALDVHGLQRTAQGAFYEVWLLRTPEHLVSLGTFRVDAAGRATVTLPVTVDPHRFPIVDVSVEPADGDPAHSARSVLRSAPIS
jgi:anti-sigma-K factor RskA